MPELPRTYLGSPPLMREGLTVCPAWYTATGITPAYAGRTQLKLEGMGASWDHPRLCGKDFN